jgi:hypothetical protein
MKYCPRCCREKPKIEFFKNKSKKDGLSGWCKICSTEDNLEWRKLHKKKARSYSRKTYSKYKEKYKIRHRKWYQLKYQEIKDKLNQYLSNHPCVDCGNTDFRVLEFDHVRGIKQYEISELKTRLNWNNLLQEIKKCDVRCANCHRIKHYEESH